jgi:hypothetical protein
MSKKLSCAYPGCKSAALPTVNYCRTHNNIVAATQAQAKQNDVLGWARAVLDFPSQINLKGLLVAIKSLGHATDQNLRVNSSYTDLVNRDWQQAIETIVRERGFDVDVPSTANIYQLRVMLERMVQTAVKRRLEQFHPARREAEMFVVIDDQPQAVVGANKSEHAIDKDIPERQRMTEEWLAAHLALYKLELLREKRQLMEARGSDTTRFAAMLARIEQELSYVEALS